MLCLWDTCFHGVLHTQKYFSSLKEYAYITFRVKLAIGELGRSKRFGMMCVYVVPECQLRRKIVSEAKRFRRHVHVLWLNGCLVLYEFRLIAMAKCVPINLNSPSITIYCNHWENYKNIHCISSNNSLNFIQF